jgi:hypothetical protein
MKNIYVRGIPDDIYRQFKSRIALDGVTVPEAAIKLFSEYGKAHARQ